MLASSDDTYFLKKHRDLLKLPEDFILYTIDVVGFYSDIFNEEGLRILRETLDKRKNKIVSRNSLVELAELVVKDNIFKFNERFVKQKTRNNNRH